MSKTVTLKHPTIEGVTQEVPADAVNEWTDAGWKATGRTATKTTEPEAK